MPDLTPEKQAELRKPFPRSSIGQLPKGGVTLDYVGHAAVTDRLLQVDPAWTWEPFALDERGLPALDSRGNLWIRLTVCGVTRVGVGDGKSAKEVIGDAIRNAAMRFGVALDLWSKEELEGSHDETTDPQPEQPAKAERAYQEQRADNDRNYPQAAPASVTDGGGITVKQLGMMGASFNEAGIKERDDRLKFVADIIGQQVASSKDLTKAQASKVIDALKQRAAPAAEARPPGQRQSWPDDQVPAEPELQDWSA